MELTIKQKAKLALVFPGLFLAMLALLVLAIVAMNVRNIGRWLNLFGEQMVGTYTYYADLWPLTVGWLLKDYKRYFGIGS